MHRFTIVPTDSSYSSAEISARDAGGVLTIVSQLQCGEADIFEDDRYKFSVRLSDSGMWSIFKRDSGE